MKWIGLVLVIACGGGEDRSAKQQPPPAGSSAAAPAPADAASAPAPADAAAVATDATAVPAAYARDVERICEVVARAGAVGLARNDQTYLTATWLGKNLETDEARAFLARIAPLQGAAKADALDAEARRAGLTACALANDWRLPLPMPVD